MWRRGIERVRRRASTAQKLECRERKEENRPMAAPIPTVTVLADPAGFLRASAPAGASLRWLLAAIDELRQATIGRTAAKLLVDLRAVNPPPSAVEQSIIGEHVAHQLAHLHKLASLVAEGTRTGMSERVARSLHLDLHVFTSEPDAIRWLTS